MVVPHVSVPVATPESLTSRSTSEHSITKSGGTTKVGGVVSTTVIV